MPDRGKIIRKLVVVFAAGRQQADGALIVFGRADLDG
jgi:hypothetical protein